MMAMKRVSVADAKNTLPALLHEAESAPIEIMRRGKPVAVLISRGSYDRLRDRGEAQRLLASIQRFRETHDIAALDIPGVFEGLRDQSLDGGRRKAQW